MKISETQTQRVDYNPRFKGDPAPYRVIGKRRGRWELLTVRYVRELPPAA
jgi:hypothetical protein